jgi:hypothetical protein
MEKVQIIPPPKEVDPRVLPWKGASVLGKMDGVADLWVTKSDWVGQFFRCSVLLIIELPWITGYVRDAWSEGKMFLSLSRIYARDNLYDSECEVKGRQQCMRLL